jgi:hypothetical protein
MAQQMRLHSNATIEEFPEAVFSAQSQVAEIKHASNVSNV